MVYIIVKNSSKTTRRGFNKQSVQQEIVDKFETYEKDPSLRDECRDKLNFLEKKGELTYE